MFLHLLSTKFCFAEEIAAGVTLSKERLKLHRFQKWLYDKIEASFIFRNWFSYKKNLAWRFMNLAQDDKQSYRARAIRSLSTMKDLTGTRYNIHLNNVNEKVLQHFHYTVIQFFFGNNQIQIISS